jgi:UDP-glucose 4-epimerase
MLEQYSRILVTGGLGFVGTHLVNMLLRLNKEGVIVDNNLTLLRTAVPQNMTLVQADIRHSSQLPDAMQGAELVFHVAGNSSGTLSVTHPRFDFETNALGTFNVVEAAFAAGVRRLVYISSASVYGRPQFFPIHEQHPTQPFIPYGTSKLTGELICLSFFQAYGFPIVIARPFCVYGPGENPKLALVEVTRYLRWHLNQQPMQIVGDMHRKTRDFIHISDLIQALLLIADKANAGEIFNVGTGEETSLRELTEVIGSVTGRMPVIHEISDLTDDTYRLVADIAKVRSLGYTPKTLLFEGIKQLAAELGENPELPGGLTLFRKGQTAEKDEY